VSAAMSAANAVLDWWEHAHALRLLWDIAVLAIIIRWLQLEPELRK
jgi:hypothetical protein